ncbi:MAG TPA: protein kinase, partial [Polyangium sp.]|nr:protein kinase [Polyangium sp.]
RVAAEIDSEHIVDIFDAGIDTTTQMPFLVMELLRGEDLRARVRRDGPLTREEVVRVLYETCMALEKTHKANIVHRDLKPDNLFLCAREHGLPRVKVLDFGIAKIVADGASDTQVTQSLGTPLYMAPEQFSMNSSVSPATDVFALGLIAYTLLTGKAYWLPESKLARSPIAFALHAAKGPKESPIARAKTLDVELPAAFDAWFFRATAEMPADRFSSAMMAITELAEVLAAPLPQEFATSQSGPISVDDSMLVSLTPDESASHEKPAHPGEPHSISLPAVRTVGASELIETPASSRPRRLIVVTGIVGILMAGPTLDALFGPHTRSAAATAPMTTPYIAIEKAPEPSISALASGPSIIMPNSAEPISAPPTTSASAMGTTAAKSIPPVRPPKPSTRVIWNND